jgi:hypothetical protein
MVRPSDGDKERKTKRQNKIRGKEIEKYIVSETKRGEERWKDGEKGTERLLV